MALIDRSRMQKGAAASVLAIAVRMLLQFLQVPILYANWHADQASAWLLIWTFPTYMVLTVGSFSSAGGTMAVAAAQAGNIAEVRAAFRATRLAITGSAAFLIVAVTLAFVAFVDLSSWGIDRQTAMLTMLCVCAYVAINVFGAGLQTVFRYGGDYGGYGFYEGLCTAGELAVTLAVVSLSNKIYLLPAALAAFRLLAVAILALRARRRWPEVFERAEPGRVRAALKAMVGPFLGFMTVPVLLAINLNGYAMLVSDMFGPALFATFLTVRTLVRLADSIVNPTFGLLYMELSYAGADQDTGRIVRLLSGFAFAGLVVTCGYTAMLLLFGAQFHQLWTAGQAGFDRNLVLVFGAGVMLRALSMPFAALLAARNAHSASNYINLILALATFGLSLTTAQMGGSLLAVAAWQIVGDVLFLLCVGYYCARQFHYAFADLIVQVCKGAPVAAWQLGRSVLRR